MANFIYAFLILLFLSGCTSPKKDYKVNRNNDYAIGFSISEDGKYTKLTVYSPWEGADKEKFDYYLSSENDLSETHENVIHVPVKRVICLSTTHIPYITALNETNTVIGLSGAEYVYDSIIYNLYQNKEIIDVGYGQNINYEQIVNMKPDVIFAYGVGSEVVGFVNRLKNLGIPVVINAEYLEHTPLGKAEWIKFMSRFYCKAETGDSIFNNIKKNYLELKEIADTCSSRPRIMTGLPFKEQWWVPGGKSHLSNLIHDSGADYLWKNNESEESFVVSVEEMIVNASDADYWIFTSGIKDLKGITDFDSRFSIFRPFKQGNVFNSDKRLSRGGGHDIWESGVLNADVMLKDFICIFHPNLFPDYEKVYYRKLE